MTILNLSDLREHIETDLSDAALQRLADAAEELIVAEAGNAAEATEYFTSWGYPRGRDRVIYAARPISSITSIEERDHPDDTPVTLSANDYEHRGRSELVRLQEGDNPRLRWARHVKLVYVPEANDATRKRVQIDLVKQGVAYCGYQRQSSGDVSVTLPPQNEAMQAALAPLRSHRMKMPFA